MVWLRDYARPALSSQQTCCDAARVVRQSRAQRERLERYELRHACAPLLMERSLPPYVVANQLGHTDGGALVQRLYPC
jgi:site-specific recombinase XerD